MPRAVGQEPLLRALYERGPVGVSVAATNWQLGGRNVRRTSSVWAGGVQAFTSLQLPNPEASLLHWYL